MNNNNGVALACGLMVVYLNFQIFKKLYINYNGHIVIWLNTNQHEVI